MHHSLKSVAYISLPNQDESPDPDKTEFLAWKVENQTMDSWMNLYPGDHLASFPDDTITSLSCPFCQRHVTVLPLPKMDKKLHRSRTQASYIHIFPVSSCTCPMTHSRCVGKAVYSLTHPWTMSHYLVHFPLTYSFCLQIFISLLLFISPLFPVDLTLADS